MSETQTNAPTGVTIHLLHLSEMSNGINRAHNQEVSEIAIATKSKYVFIKNLFKIIGRQWAYLQCTQSALFQITDDYTWMPNRIESPYRVEQCEDVLGEE